MQRYLNLLRINTTVFTLIIMRTTNNFNYKIITIFVTIIRGCTNIRGCTIIEIKLFNIKLNFSILIDIVH